MLRGKKRIILSVLFVCLLLAAAAGGWKYYQTQLQAKSTVITGEEIGYMKYLDCYIYFDDQGNVLRSVVCEKADAQEVEQTEVSHLKVEGLNYQRIALNQQISVEDKTIFQTISALDKILTKFEVFPEKVRVENNEFILIYGSVEVILGKDTLLEEKIARLSAIYPNLAGLSGKLHLEDFTKDTKEIIFEKNIE